MRGSGSLLSVVAVLAVALAACSGGGGGGASSSEPAAGAGESQAPIAKATQAAGEASATPAPATPAPASEAPAGGGGGPAAGVCELVTADELQGILGVSVSLHVLAGPPDTCDIQSTDGAPLAATVLTVMSAQTASAVFDAYAAAPGAESFAGIGDEAAYDPSQQVLVVRKADKLLTVAVFDDGTSDEAARLELMKQIASTAAGRM
jgi:hypothetical protein